MRDKPVAVEPEYTPAGPGAESQGVPDNPPPVQAPNDDDGDDPAMDLGNA